MSIHTMPRTEYSSRYSSLVKAGSPDVVRYLSVLTEQERYRYPDLGHYEHQLEQHRRSPWVYVAVNMIATAVAQMQFEVFQRAGEKLVAQNNHPIEILLQSPSPEYSRFETLEATVGFWLLTGNSYWLLDGVPGGKPDRIYVLRPDRMRVMAGNSQQLVAGYVYTVGGVEIPFEAEEIIHFKMFNPRSDLYGMSPMEAAALAIQSDISMAEWNRNFFGKENAIPAGVVNIKRPVTDPEFNRIKRRWNENYGGHARKTAFLTEADMQYQDIGVSHKDMDFSAGREFERKVIFEVYGVPLGKFDPSATEANALAADDTFTDDTVWPACLRLTEKMTLGLTPFWGDGLVIKPKEIRKSPGMQLRNELVSYAPYLSINEVRQEYQGKDPVLWGDGPASGAGSVIVTGMPVNKPSFVPKPQDLQLTPDDQQARQDAEDTTPGDEAEKSYLTRAGRREIEQFARFAAKRLEDRREQVEAFTFHAVPDPVALAVKAYVDVCDDEHDLEIFSLVDYKASPADPYAAIRQKAVRQFSAATGEYLNKLQADAISGVKHVGANPKALAAYFNARYWVDTQKEMSAALVPIYAQVVEKITGEHADRLEMAYGLPVDPGAIATAANQVATEWADQVIPGIVSTTRDGLQALLDRMALQFPSGKGGPLDWLKDLIQTITDSPLFGAARALLIAVNEVARGIARGILEAIGLATDDGKNVPLLYDPDQAEAMIPLHTKCDCYWEEQEVMKGGKLVGITLVWRHPKPVVDQRCKRCADRDGKTYDQVLKIAQDEGVAVAPVGVPAF